MRPSNRPPRERETSIAITTGNKSPVRDVVIGGDLYQNCIIILPDIKTSNETRDVKEVHFMSDPKIIFCEVWEAIIYSTQCLLEMGKVAKENKICERCVYHDNIILAEKLRRKSLQKGHR